MNKKERKKYEEFLVWLITPQNEKESQLFKDKNLVDDYIEILNSIPGKTDDQLLDSLDIQLEKFGKEINRTKIKN